MSWRGLKIAGERLWVAPVRHLPGRVRLRFEPHGLVVVVGSGEHLMHWDEGFPRRARPGDVGWWLIDDSSEFPRLRVVRDRMTVALPAHDGIGYTGEAQRWTLSAGYGLRLLSFAVDESVALADYLTKTPEARAGLADVVRLERLLARLRSSRGRVPPFRAFVGRKADIDTAIEGTLDKVWPRRFCGIGVEGETAPAQDEIVRAVGAALPAHLSEVSRETLVERVSRLHPTQRWPFNELLDPTDS